MYSVCLHECIYVSVDVFMMFVTVPSSYSKHKQNNDKRHLLIFKLSVLLTDSSSILKIVSFLHISSSLLIAT